MKTEENANRRKITLLPMLKERKRQLALRKTLQRHRIKLNEDIEMVKSLSFDTKVDDVLEHMREIKNKLENIDQNEEMSIKRKGEKEDKDKNNSAKGLNYRRGDSIFKIKEDSLQHILKMESEKQFEMDLSLKTNELTILKTEIDHINNFIAHFQDEINNLSLDIDLLGNYPKYSKNSNQVEVETINKKSKVAAFARMSILAQGHYSRVEKRDKMEKDKLELITKINTEREKLGNLKRRGETVKNEIKKIKNKMRDYYQVSLYKGADFRQEGLIFYIKAIWSLGFDVDLKFMPTFLDKESIDYLFIAARKSIEISSLRQKIWETKMKNSKELRNQFNNFKFETGIRDDNLKISAATIVTKCTQIQEAKEEKYTLRKVNASMANKRPLDRSILIVFASMNKLAFKLNQLELEVIDNREKEIKRIAKEYIVNDYANKYGVSIETLVSALVGESYKDKELNHYTHIKNVIYYLFIMIII